MGVQSSAVKPGHLLAVGVGVVVAGVALLEFLLIPDRKTKKAAGQGTLVATVHLGTRRLAAEQRKYGNERNHERVMR